jgi:hypothetical protein
VAATAHASNQVSGTEVVRCEHGGSSGNVERAQQHYRDVLGFEIGFSPGKDIGAVSRGDVAIFFRKRKPPFEPALQWVFAEDIAAS